MADVPSCLHPEAAALLKENRANGVQPFSELGSIEAAREVFNQNSLARAGSVDFRGDEKEYLVPSKDWPG